MNEKQRLKEMIKILEKEHPDARCLLIYTNPLELLIATILAAQCTDDRVNKTTPGLFKKFPNADSYTNASLSEIEEIIKPCGFFRQKAKNIQNTCAKIMEKFDANVPRTMEELVTLPGVGRKTANVVLSECFNTDGSIVDTHVKRLSNRLGISSSDEPDKIEQDIMNLVPEGKWALFSHLLSFHGRKICTARSPKCNICKLINLCPEGKNILGKKE